MNLSAHFGEWLHRSGISAQQRVLVAVSGGADSMVLLDLFRCAGVNVSAAHAHFGLRGEASDRDHDLVQAYCRQHQIACFSRPFDVQAYMDTHQTGIQEAARNLRYAWFHELAELHGFDHIATAHHRDDVTETVLLHITRGTGIAGLRGIPARNGKIIRPLLAVAKSTITGHAAEHQVPFREDSSNSSNAYARNKIRNLVVPVLREINPALDEHVRSLTQQLGFAERIYRQHIEDRYRQCCHVNGVQTIFAVPALLALDDLYFYLFEFLHPFGFNATQVTQIMDALHGQSGKRFYSATHLLLKDRDTLVATPLHADEAAQEIAVDHGQTLLGDAILQIEQHPADAPVVFAAPAFFIDADTVTFPLHVRKWAYGDQFMPLGMTHEKKVSDFFVDHKVSLIDKDRAWMLCDAEQRIIAVLPYRIAEPVKLTERSQRILKITWQQA